jgi:hypothetical protein
MTSHREAPGISKDPVADNTDLYAFVSPDKSNTVTIIANYIPLQLPPGGPNFYKFGDDVSYNIYLDNNSDAKPEITYTFRFKTEVQDEKTFLYNTGQITSLTDSTWNIRQVYSVSRTDSKGTRVLGSNLPTPPVNIGPRSTPHYANLAAAALNVLSDGSMSFAGQRGEGFYVDLGSIFDLLTLRPFENYHLIPTPAVPGVNTTSTLNVHSIALQVPISLLTKDGSVPTSVTDTAAVLGIWAAASRQEVTIRNNTTPNSSPAESGPWKQVSRLGNPLINEIVIPLGMKDYWNSQNPVNDSQFEKYYLNLEVASLMPVLYPAALTTNDGVPNAPNNPRKDIAAILGTGIPTGLISGFQNYTGPTFADMLRLNVAISPNTSTPSPYGVIGGDLAGFPNGRRPNDDTVAIYLRVAAGVTYPLIDSTFVPPTAAAVLGDFSPTLPTVPFLTNFPYLPTPYDGFDYTPGTDSNTD